MSAWKVSAQVTLTLALVASNGCLEGDPNPVTGASGSNSSGTVGGSTSSSSSSSGNTGPVPTVQPTSQCSGTNGASVDITFLNQTTTPVMLFWVNQQCNETSYGVIGPGGGKLQQTFVNHRWRIRDLQTSALYKEVLIESGTPTTITIP